MRRIVLRVDRKNSALEKAGIILEQGRQQAFFILLFAALYLFRDLTDVNIPDIIFSGLCAVAFILLDKGTSLGVYVFTTALTVPHNEITLIYIVILIAKMFLAGKTKVNGKMVLMSCGLLMLQLVNITLFSDDSIGDALYDYITRMLILLVPLFWFDADYSAEDFQRALLCYAVGVILGGTVTLLLTAERVTWEVLLKGSGGNRLGQTYNTEEGMQTNYNANQLSIMFAITTAIILQHIDRKRISKVLGVVLLGYSVFLVVLTRSRTGLLMVAFGVLVYYLVLVFRRKRIFGGLLLLGAVAGIMFLVVYFIPGVVEGVVGRFTEQEDITNGRADLFVDYLQAWVNDLWCFFFGYGLGNAFGIVGTTHTPHNAITDVLISFGLVGFFLIVGIVISCWRTGISKVDKKDRTMALLPAMVALIASMASQYVDTGYPHPRLCFLFLAAGACSTKKMKEEPTKEKDR